MKILIVGVACLALTACASLPGGSQIDKAKAVGIAERALDALAAILRAHQPAPPQNIVH